jgi:GNAT superfamily N-acetyltransferase
VSAALRPAGVDDARAVAEIAVDTWRSTYRGIIPDSVLDALSVAKREASMRERLADPRSGFRMALAEERGRTVGFVAYGPSRDDDARLDAGEVYAIYVRRELWGHGLGGALLAHAVCELRALGSAGVTLWTLGELERTVRFYSHAGFAADGATRTEELDGVAVRYVRLAALTEPSPR